MLSLLEVMKNWTVLQSVHWNVLSLMKCVGLWYILWIYMVHLCVYCILNVIHHWYDRCCYYQESTSIKVVYNLRLNSNKLHCLKDTIIKNNNFNSKRFLPMNLWLLKFIYNDNIYDMFKTFPELINELLKPLPGKSHT